MSRRTAPGFPRDLRRQRNEPGAGRESGAGDVPPEAAHLLSHTEEQGVGTVPLGYGPEPGRAFRGEHLDRHHEIPSGEPQPVERGSA